MNSKTVATWALIATTVLSFGGAAASAIGPDLVVGKVVVSGPLLGADVTSDLQDAYSALVRIENAGTDTSSSTTVRLCAASAVDEGVAGVNPATGSGWCGFGSIPSLASGETADVRIDLTSGPCAANAPNLFLVCYPAHLQEGPYDACAYADSSNRVAELNETNNVRCTRFVAVDPFLPMSWAEGLAP